MLVRCTLFFPLFEELRVIGFHIGLAERGGVLHEKGLSILDGFLYLFCFVGLTGLCIESHPCFSLFLHRLKPGLPTSLYSLKRGVSSFHWGALSLSDPDGWQFYHSIA